MLMFWSLWNVTQLTILQCQISELLERLAKAILMSRSSCSQQDSRWIQFGGVGDLFPNKNLRDRLILRCFRWQMRRTCDTLYSLESIWGSVICCPFLWLLNAAFAQVVTNWQTGHAVLPQWPTGLLCPSAICKNWPVTSFRRKFHCGVTQNTPWAGFCLICGKCFVWWILSGSVVDDWAFLWNADGQHQFQFSPVFEKFNSVHSFSKSAMKTFSLVCPFVVHVHNKQKRNVVISWGSFFLHCIRPELGGGATCSLWKLILAQNHGSNLFCSKIVKKSWQPEDKKLFPVQVPNPQCKLLCNYFEKSLQEIHEDVFAMKGLDDAERYRIWIQRW